MENKTFIIQRVPTKVTTENISDLLACAFEGGINYWCGGVEIASLPNPNENEDLMASDVIAIGGILHLYDAEDEDVVYELTLEKMLSGIKWGIEWGKFSSMEDLMDNHDAETADVIIQYALFGEITFG